MIKFRTGGWNVTVNMFFKIYSPHWEGLVLTYSGHEYENINNAWRKPQHPRMPVITYLQTSLQCKLQSLNEEICNEVIGSYGGRGQGSLLKS